MTQTQGGTPSDTPAKVDDERNFVSTGKISSMDSVREYTEGGAVELWRNAGGRLVIRTFHRGRSRHTDLDAVDLLKWIKLADRRTEPSFGPDDGPLGPFFREIDAALDVGMTRLAVIFALTIPELCSALEVDGRWTGKEKYDNWYDQYLSPIFRTMTAADFHILRWGLLHHSTMSVTVNGSAFDSIEFAAQGMHSRALHNSVINNVLQFDCRLFCSDMIAAARRWYECKNTDANVEKNLADLTQPGPSGLTTPLAGGSIYGQRRG